jgi:hypothetical protein
MRLQIVIVLVAIMGLPSLATAKEGDWGFIAQVLYGPRDISGTILTNPAGPTAGDATTESLGLGTSKSFQYMVGFNYKRWSFDVVSMPTTFTGDGFAEGTIDLGGDQVIAGSVPVSSDINIDLVLVNVMYDLIQKETFRFGIGLGAGRTTIDVSLVPQIGQGIVYSGNTPFGFLALDLEKNWGRWGLGVGAQGISITSNDSSMDYSNLNVVGSYRFYQKKWFSSVVVGYRRVGFDFDYNLDSGETKTDVVLTGPYIGLTGGF